MGFNILLRFRCRPVPGLLGALDFVDFGSHRSPCGALLSMQRPRCYYNTKVL